MLSIVKQGFSQFPCPTNRDTWLLIVHPQQADLGLSDER